MRAWPCPTCSSSRSGSVAVRPGRRNGRPEATSRTRPFFDHFLPRRGAAIPVLRLGVAGWLSRGRAADAVGMTSPAPRRSQPPARLIRASAPLAWALAGRPWFPLWAVVRHRGRSSGKPYATPVAIIPTRSQVTFLIGLPWGPSTNWAQNVLAAGGATLVWRGREIEVTNPRLAGTEVAVEQARPLFRPILRRGRFPAFLQMDRSSP
jgi:deazaflavin-dependent oxidoreductase (nitroreductase family)